MRIIDADALIKKAEMRGRCLRPLVTAYSMCVDVHDIEDAPTIDAVPVVRCKDCKYWENGKGYEPYCNHWGNMMSETEPDYFCSYGERKDDGC